MSKKNLVPIKVKLTKKVNGHIDWPEFNLIDSKIRKNLPASVYVDTHGIGWHYDKVENLGTGHPNGAACTLVPKDFAEAAASRFPKKVSLMRESEWEAFYNGRCHCQDPVEFLDVEVLQGILARVQLEEKKIAGPPSEDIKSIRKRALDPNEIQIPGIRKNDRKTWSLLRETLRLSIHPDYQ